ncbi:MAG: hypothetical protein AAF840_03475, partial [Bacteroidota bacterium]
MKAFKHICSVSFILFLSCNVDQAQNSEKLTTIAGTYKNNYSGEELTIRNENIESDLHVVKLDSTESFSLSISIDKPQYYYIGNTGIKVYLEPGKDINIQYDEKTYDPHTAAYKGANSDIQNYLSQQYKETEDLYNSAFDSLPSQFLDQLLIYKDKQFKALESSEFPEEFIKTQKEILFIEGMISRIYHEDSNYYD